ncbi:MAG TPA: oxidoreductase [Firmicutes bacterium]|jgi:uncharacterized protein YxjI|nr:oxidoreductase [Bacillota bacterium]
MDSRLLEEKQMLLDKKTFLIKEQIDFLKLAGTYDIFDPETGRQIGVAKEEPGALIKLLRLLVYKVLLPNKINIYDHEEQRIVCSIQKPFSLVRAKISVVNRTGECLGYFQSKILTLGGGFWVFDPENRQVAEIKGDWKGWNFKFIGTDDQEFGSITKKWAGIGKELFTTADNYVIAIKDTKELDLDRTALLLAAGLAIDIVFKERR